MGVVTPRKFSQIAEATDKKKAILEAVGDLSDIEVMFNQVLVGIYFRPAVTAGGIIMPQSTQQEDQYQGKIGLVLKVGPTAFQSDNDTDFAGQSVKEGDWIVLRPGDGWELTLRETTCRLVTDRNVRMKIADPLTVF